MGICWGRGKRRRGGIEEGRGGETADGQRENEREIKQLRVVERDTITSETEKIRFGDIEMEKMKLKVSEV